VTIPVRRNAAFESRAVADHPDSLDRAWVTAEAARLSNAGRWGDADEIGAWNCVDAKKIAQAVACVTKHQVFGLSLPFGADGPNSAGPPGRSDPMHFLTMTGADLVAAAGDGPINSPGFADDWVVMNLSCSTQWDGFTHVFMDGLTYNNLPASQVTANRGARRQSIAALRERVVTRSVLLDIPRLQGVEWLPGGFAIGPEHLDAACERQEVSVEPGDVVLVRTGALTRVRTRGTWADYAATGPQPGLGARSAAWLAERDVAAVATDTWGAEVLPYETHDTIAPLHQILLSRCGISIGEMFDLDALAADNAADGVHVALFVAPPLPITGAVNSPINPLAIK
jgi:kynurenine formamidase